MYFKKLNNGSDEQFVGEANVVAPFSTIQNRAKVEANCKVVGPVERIRINSLKEVPNEFGPNGEKVFTSDKEDSRVRFIGEDFNTTFNDAGTAPRIASGVTPSSIIEITFYGTGLNAVTESGIGVSSSYSVDDSVTYTQFKSDISNILLNRNVNSNILVKVVSGLDLGWHTVRIKKDNSTGTYTAYGFEILNESSDLSILSGSVYKNGYEYILENGTTLPMIPTSYSGSNGGRVLTYIDPSDGQVKQALNEVGTPAYLGATDHSNEAIYRKINFREFGRNRADDFSTIAGADDRAFTLDDGTTTLVCFFSGVATYNNIQGIVPNNNTHYITITFVGTGLDIVTDTGSSIVSNNHELFVDGVSQGNIITNPNETKTIKIVSGLPYGTHTVKILKTSTDSNQTAYADFIVYQPKKPTLPKEAFILSDYNLMADYVQNTDATASLLLRGENLSTGLMRKHTSREVIYNGTWSAPQNSAVAGGINLQGTAIGSYLEYTFVGSGVEFWYAWSSNVQASILLDGQPLSTTGTTNVVSGAYNSGTSRIEPTDNCKFQLTDLPFGKHIIRFTMETGTFFQPLLFDIISPIHSPNTSIGNLSMSDMREQKETYPQAFGSVVQSGKLRESFNIAQLLSVSPGVTLVYLEDVFITNNYVITGTITDSSGRTVNTGSIPYIHSYGINTTDINGNIGDREVSTTASGRLQKDIFKD